MECPRCQTRNAGGRRFCITCSAALPQACRECGAPIAGRQNFCGQCGAPLADGLLAEDAIVDRRPHAPERIAARILHARATVEGERKQVTVLFADIRGSTSLIEGLDAEQAWRRLDPALEAMREAVHRYDGTVNRLQGDGLMALFGAPLAHEDHAVRACYAALAMQETMARLADPLLAIRVGLHSGEVVVRAIRSDLSMEYEAIGPTVHLASRMEQAAAPGTIRLTGATRSLAQGFIETRALGAVAVKGLSVPVETFELTGAAASRTRWQASATGQLTGFVGRARELEQLRQTLRQTEAGGARPVCVIGEPGVGKSRLIWEFSAGCRERGWRVLHTGATSYSTEWPYRPVVELLEGDLALVADDDRPVAAQLETRLAALDPALQDTLPALLAVLGVPRADPVWDALDPGQRRQRIRTAVTRLLRRESEAQPLLLIVEDLQWVDAETDGLLEHLARELADARVLLLASARPECRAPWLAASGAVRLVLDGLAADSADAFLDTLLGGDPELEPLKRLLLQRTGGNPFFIEESVRSLLETGALTGPRGAHRLARALHEVRVPATVEALLAVRIDRLPVPRKRLLQAAAVVGIDVALPILQRVVDLPEDELARGLEELRTAEFLVERTAETAPSYGFRHALTHEVAYSGLLREQRAALHRRVVFAIEGLYGTRLTEHAEMLAHHALRGERWGAAARYLHEAGNQALARSANVAATSYFEEALAALAHLPKDRSNLERAVDLRFGLRNSLLALGEPERILRYLHEADALATGLDDRARVARASSNLTHCLWLAGDWRRAVETGRRALDLARAQDDFAVRVTTNFYIGLAHYSLGEYRTAVDYLGRNAAVLHGRLAEQRFGMFALPAVVSRSWLALCEAERGGFAEGFPVAEAAMAIARIAGQPFDLVQAELGIGGLLVHQGEIERAMPALARGIELCRSAPVPVLLPRAAGTLGWALALVGRVDEALPLLEEAAGRAAAMNLKAMHGMCRRWLSEAHLLAGRRHRAEAEAAQALEECRGAHARGLQAWLLEMLGKIAAQADGSPDRAERHYRQALALARQLEMRPLQAHCHLGLGGLLTRESRTEEARGELAAAGDLYDALGMRFWDRAVREARGRPAAFA